MGFRTTVEYEEFEEPTGKPRERPPTV